MAREGNVSGRSKSKRRIRSKSRDCDDSDEDFVISEEEELLEISESYCSSLDGDASEDSFEEEEEEGLGESSKPCSSKRRNGAYHQFQIGCKASRKRGRSVCREKIEGNDSDYDDSNGDDEAYNYDDGEDEDEEFTPDEDDFSDDEEETWVERTENKMKKRSQGSKKPLQMKRRKIGRSRTNVTFTVPTFRVKSKKKGIRRKESSHTSSDLGFRSSESSDYEYTISDEEKEQVMEAKELCENLRTHTRNPSFPTKSEENACLSKQRKPSRNSSRKVKAKRSKPLWKKGKEKIDELKTEAVKQVCGICLSEEDRRKARGKLNCCTHYFCFACITEWAKVESRCPVCKQRFQTISKPARITARGDSKEVVIQIPERDQVYQPSEEEIRNFMDPYDHVICSECQEGGEEALMLLCDSCDLPAHTFCVGLGLEVPEGSWYCYGCRPVASSSSQAQERVSHQGRISQAMHTQESPRVNVVEGIDLNLMPPRSFSLTQISSHLSPPRVTTRIIQVPSFTSGVGNPAISGRLWMHPQIHQLMSVYRMNSTASRIGGLSNQNTMNHNLYASRINRTSIIIQHATMQAMGASNPPRTALSYFSSQGGQGSTTVANRHLNGTIWPGFPGVQSI